MRIRAKGMPPRQATPRYSHSRKLLMAMAKLKLISSAKFGAAELVNLRKNTR